MMIKKFEVERFSVTSSKSFDLVVAALEGSVGHPDMAKFNKAIKEALTFAQLETIVRQALGGTELMIFMKLDSGAILRKETGHAAPRIMRFIVGNPLIMKEMAKHIPDAASYAPVTILIDERSDGVHLSYDRMTSLLAPYGNSASLTVARSLDAKIEKLLRYCC